MNAIHQSRLSKCSSLSSDLRLLFTLLLIALLLFTIGLLFIVDLFEVELVAGVLLILLVSNDHHSEYPDVDEDEACDIEPHRLLGKGLAKCNMAPKNNGVHGIVQNKGQDNICKVCPGVYIEALIELDILFEVGQLIVLLFPVTHFFSFIVATILFY